MAAPTRAKTRRQGHAQLELARTLVADRHDRPHPERPRPPGLAYLHLPACLQTRDADGPGGQHARLQPPGVDQMRHGRTDLQIFTALRVALAHHAVEGARMSVSAGHARCCARAPALARSSSAIRRCARLVQLRLRHGIAGRQALPAVRAGWRPARAGRGHGRLWARASSGRRRNAARRAWPAARPPSAASPPPRPPPRPAAALATRASSRLITLLAPSASAPARPPWRYPPPRSRRCRWWCLGRAAGRQGGAEGQAQRGGAQQGFHGLCSGSDRVRRHAAEASGPVCSTARAGVAARLRAAQAHQGRQQQQGEHQADHDAARH